MEWASAGGAEFVRVAFGGWRVENNFALIGGDDADFRGWRGGGNEGFSGGGAIGPAGAEDFDEVAVVGPAWAVELVAGDEGDLHGGGSENIAIPIDDAAGWAGVDGDGMRRERGAALGWRLGGWARGGAGGEERASG